MKGHRRKDLLLTLAGIGTAVITFALSFNLSESVRQELTGIQREASVARAGAVLQALDQNAQHLSDYTLGYAMWDDSYAYVQYPRGDYPETNYANDVLSVSPINLVAIYASDRRILFSTAVNEEGKSLPVPSEIATPAFSQAFATLGPDVQSLSRFEWLDGRPYLLSIWPITDSTRSAPPRGFLLFGKIIDPKMLARVQALTDVTAIPSAGRLADSASDPELSLRTPVLGPARLALIPADRSISSRAEAVFDHAASEPERSVHLDLKLPSDTSGAAARLGSIVQTDFLLVTAAFAVFAGLAGLEIVRRRRELRARIAEAEELRAARTRAERLAEEAAQADRAKSAFLAMMSHEIRTPLNAIIGYAELLKTAPLDTESAQGLQAIRDSGSGLLRVLNDVLDFSRMEAEALPMHPEPLQLRRLAAEVVALFQPVARTAGNRLEVAVADAVPEWILADPLRMKQVLSNLVLNGLKFTEGGTVRIVASVRPAPGATPTLEVAVEDEGIGVSPTDEKRLFLAFSQVESAPARRYGGSGLGLAICRRLCRLMGGDVTYQRREPRGSSFAFEIPCLVPAEIPPPLVALIPGLPAFGRDGTAAISVLVVDDIPNNGRLLALVLKRLGIDCRVVLSGAEAIARYEEEPADLILMDVEMPGMDGLETTRRIREWEADHGLPASRIVAVTANVLETHRSAAREAGMDDYLPKPVNFDRLRDIVEASGPLSLS